MTDVNPESRPLVTAGPNRVMWWMLLLFIPLGTIVLVAVPLGIVAALFNWTPPRELVWGLWAGLTVAIIAWCFVYDAELLTWTLTTSDLRRGKRWPRVMFRFDEIESIVVGIPPCGPWYLSWARGHPAVLNAFQVRSLSIFVRLHGGRRMLLNFKTGQFRDGEALMEEFVRLHAAKMVGLETFTKQELRRMGTAFLNRIFRVRPAD